MLQCVFQLLNVQSLNFPLHHICENYVRQIIFITGQAADQNPDYEPSSIYDGMYEDNQATDSHDDTYDHMYEHD